MVPVKHEKIRNMVLAALFAALIYVATNLIHIPTPATNGYVNLGDCMVLLGAFLLGPVYGAAAAAIGSALADLLLGYIAYAPATFLIKGLMAVCAALMFRGLKHRMSELGAAILGGIAAECIMVLGYFAYEAVFLGYGWAAAASIVGNCFQAVTGVALGVVFRQILAQISPLKRMVHAF